jgi:Baseplate J-like protein
MALSLSDLLKAQTADDVMATFLNVASTLGLPVTAWQRLGVGRSILRTVAQKVADLTSIVSEIAAGGFLDYAAAVTPEGGPGWLDLVTKNMYSTERKPASFARGSLSVSNTSGTTYTINPGDLHFASTENGATYTNQDGGSLAPSSTLLLTIAADNPGAGGTTSAGTITILVTPLTGVTCTNPGALVGNDVETNADLVTRARAQLKSVSPAGPKDAYNYGARNALRADGSLIAVSRTRSIADGTGHVDLYIAGPNGAIDTGDVPFVDAAALAMLPLDGTLTTVNAANLSVTVTGVITVTVASQLTDAQVIAAAKAQILKFFSEVAIGGYAGVLYAESIRGQIALALGAAFITCSLSAPSGDVAMAANEVPTLNIASSFTVVRF